MISVRTITALIAVMAFMSTGCSAGGETTTASSRSANVPAATAEPIVGEPALSPELPDPYGIPRERSFVTVSEISDRPCIGLTEIPGVISEPAVLPRLGSMAQRAWYQLEEIHEVTGDPLDRAIEATARAVGSERSGQQTIVLGDWTVHAAEQVLSQGDVRLLMSDGRDVMIEKDGLYWPFRLCDGQHRLETALEEFRGATGVDPQRVLADVLDGGGTDLDEYLTWESDYLTPDVEDPKKMWDSTPPNERLLEAAPPEILSLYVQEFVVVELPDHWRVHPSVAVVCLKDQLGWATCSDMNIPEDNEVLGGASLLAWVPTDKRGDLEVWILASPSVTDPGVRVGSISYEALVEADTRIAVVADVNTRPEELIEAARARPSESIAAPTAIEPADPK